MENLFYKPVISLEAIVQKLTGLMHLELTMALEAQRAKGKMDVKDLAGIVTRHTRLSPIFNLDNSAMPNAFVVPPQVDKNSPMINDWRKAWALSDAGNSAVNYSKGSAVGWVDLEKCKVGGVFEKMAFEVFVTRGAFLGLGPKPLKPAEVSAIIIHELGHVFVYFMTLAQTFRTAFFLQGFVRDYLALSEKEQRYTLLKEVEDKYKIKFNSKDAIIESQNQTVIATMVLAEVADSNRSQFGTTLYDMRTWETLSDQFASRQGAAADLSTALGKIYHQYDPSVYRGTFSFYLIEAIKTIFLILIIGQSVMSLDLLRLLICFGILSCSPHEREYDKPVERVTKLKIDLIAQLKSCDSKDSAKALALVKDIDTVDDVLSTMKDRNSFFEIFWLVISPNTRRQVKMGKEIQELEKLVNNDLFVSANKLKHLA